MASDNRSGNRYAMASDNRSDAALFPIITCAAAFGFVLGLASSHPSAPLRALALFHTCFFILQQLPSTLNEP
jgi:hypothetical protein